MKSKFPAFVLLFLFTGFPAIFAQQSSPDWLEEAISLLENDFGKSLDYNQQSQLKKGLHQVADFWREEDGSSNEFKQFVRKYFAADEDQRLALFNRLQSALEILNGHFNEIVLHFRLPVDLDTGPLLPVDEILAAYSPAAHIDDDFFANKLAFVVLLNFPLSTLEERLQQGQFWSRQQWAETRLAHRFAKRIPAEVNQTVATAGAAADQYIAGYNIWMHHIVQKDGRRLYPEGMRLLVHWNLRDQIKADYSDPINGFNKQKTILKIMERIVDQSIPAAVIDNPQLDWAPFENTVSKSAVIDSDVSISGLNQPVTGAEPDIRYAMLLKNFQAARLVDAYSPTAPTKIQRAFNENREIPEDRVHQMFEKLLTAPQLKKVAFLIRSRLGRPLETFDIWYNGFLPRGKYSEAELDSIVSNRYPTAQAYRKDMPNLLEQLGFSPARSQYLADNILVEPARGSGHAWGAAMRSAKSHLRTRIGKNGMDYKGFNIAVHEMGHNVEQVFSLKNIDYTSLAGVPNNAFTEALAFVFQNKDIELLGLSKPAPENEALRTINDYWATCEIAAVALVDMAVWHWMYEHPECTPAQLKEAVIGIAKNIWNKYYAPVLNVKNSAILGIYSHMIHYPLYLPDYPIGHMIAFQVEEQMHKAGAIGPEFERMATIGNIAPDLWMIQATGQPVGPEALLEATNRALSQLK